MPFWISKFAAGGRFSWGIFCAFLRSLRSALATPALVAAVAVPPQCHRQPFSESRHGAAASYRHHCSHLIAVWTRRQKRDDEDDRANRRRGSKSNRPDPRSSHAEHGRFSYGDADGSRRAPACSPACSAWEHFHKPTASPARFHTGVAARRSKCQNRSRSRPAFLAQASLSPPPLL